MADDVTPALIEKVNKDFKNNLASDKRAGELLEKLKSGKASYDDAYAYAERVGRARAKAFGTRISSNVLPNGKMYYHIGSKLVGESLKTDHGLVAEYANTVQTLKNKRSGINIKSQKADLNPDRIKGFVDRLASEEVYDDVAWILDEPVITYARGIVDDTIKKNADFQYRAGVSAKIVRTSSAECCDWCADVEGEYNYPNVPREVFQRHDNCRCTVDYEGRRLTAYSGRNGSHSFRDQGEQERIDARKRYAEQINASFTRKRI